MATSVRRRVAIAVGAVATICVVALVVLYLTVLRPTSGSNATSSSSSPRPSASPSGTAGTSAAASPSAPTTAAPAPSSDAPAPASSAPVTAAPSLAAQKLASMTLEQKVGQVLMVSSPVTGADANSVYAVNTLPVGNVFMKGRTTAGVQGAAAVVAALTAQVSGTAGVGAFVATDQEGGFVQIMQGPGFDRIPQAIEQGQLDPNVLRSQATQWGQQLAAAGVNVNLAPVLDTVPGADFAAQNAPIGVFGREYGFTPEDVSSHGLAFARGMAAAGVDTTVKHFPGLGRVLGNTDVSAGVTDSTTVRNDPYLGPFRDAVASGVPWLMISNAFYPNLDPVNLAPFSPVIVTDMVRGDLGFTGIVVSDDLCDAVQVSAVPVAARGANFIAAGGTMALCTNQALLPQMYQGMVAAAQGSADFAAKIDAAALLVLQSKATAGLLSP